METLVKKARPSKGERLKWAKVQTVGAVVITAELMAGKFVSESEHKKRSRNSNAFLVP